MKKTLLIWLGAAALLLASCTENNWMDWKVQNDLWLAQNALKDSVVTTSTGLQYKIIANPNPTGPTINDTKTVVLDYSGMLINGCVFDRNDHAVFAVTEFVSGFAEGLRKIREHGDIEVYVPYYLGYDEEKYNNDEINKAEGFGTEGTSSYIPPYSVLIFKVHVSAVY